MMMDTNEKNINEDDGQIIHLENNFNSVSKYVNTATFSEAYIENNFGSCNVYFNNAVMQNQSAKIELDNNFGQMNIYFPGTWRVKINQDISFGNLKIHGEPNADMDAPCVFIDADCAFGNLNLYFE
jgi:predicted membrane protein